MIGERLCELRKDKGLTQKELGDELALSKYTISSYEKEKSSPDDDTKVKLAKYFNVSLDYLLGLIDEPYSFVRDENIIILPRELPLKEKQHINNYVAFISEKYRKKERI